MLPWVTKPFASPPGKSSPHRAEMLQDKCTGRADVTVIFWYFIIMVNAARYVDSGTSKMFRFSVQGFLSLDAGRQNLLNCLFFQNKLFNINADYPVAHFKESNSNFQSFGDLIFFWIYGQSPRSLCMVSFLRHLYFSRDHFKDIQL